MPMMPWHYRIRCSKPVTGLKLFNTLPYYEVYSHVSEEQQGAKGEICK